MERLTKRIVLDKGTDEEREVFVLDNDKIKPWQFSDLINKIAEYENAEEQGLIVKLPCKVGDKIYYLRSYTVGHFDTGYVVQDTEFSINCLNRDFGLKSCFYLTKAEALQALKERE